MYVCSFDLLTAVIKYFPTDTIFETFTTYWDLLQILQNQTIPSLQRRFQILFPFVWHFKIIFGILAGLILPTCTTQFLRRLPFVHTCNHRTHAEQINWAGRWYPHTTATNDTPTPDTRMQRGWISNFTNLYKDFEFKNNNAFTWDILKWQRNNFSKGVYSISDDNRVRTNHVVMSYSERWKYYKFCI
jgi:hypothetical protein